jgi:hypothetical protein
MWCCSSDKSEARWSSKVLITRVLVPITSIAMAAASNVRNHDRFGSSRPVLSLRRALPATTQLSLDPSCQNLKWL